MILQTITKNYTQAIISTIVVGLLLWLNVFISPVSTSVISHDAIGYQLIGNALSGVPLLANIIALALIFFQAFALAGFSGRFNLLGRTNMMPALLFVVLSSFQHDANFLNPVVLSGVLLVVLLHKVGEIGEKTEAVRESFDAGMIIALASMFYIPSIIFMLFLWFTLVSYRIFRWREWVASLMGLVLPYLFLTLIYFFSDQLGIRAEEFWKELQFDSFDKLYLNVSNVIFYSCIMLVFIPALVRFIARRNEKTVYIRHIISVALNYLITVVILMIITREFYAVALSLLFMPMALIISDYLSTLKKSFYREFFFLLIIGVVIATKLMGYA